MTDYDYEFEQSCKEAAKSVYDEAIDSIKSGDSIDDIEDKLFEAADSEVPIYTYQLYQLVACLDEQWEEVDREQTFDIAIRQACFYAAMNHVSNEFSTLGGVSRLEELQEAHEAMKSAMEESNPEKAFAEVMALYPEEMKELGIDVDMPQPKMGGPK